MLQKITILFLIFALSGEVFSQSFKVNINKLTEETQQLSESPDTMRLVWWIPTDFWEAVFSQDQSIPNEEANNMLSQFEKYTIIAAIDGSIDAEGTIDYVSKDIIFNKLKVINNQNSEFSPLLEDEIDLDTKRLITFIKPVITNMLGKLGENMHFFLFQNREDPFNKIVNPKNKEAFVIKLNDEQFKWNLPLGSLLKPKMCPVDKQLLNGAWQFCPYHGKRLVVH